MCVNNAAEYFHATKILSTTHHQKVSNMPIPVLPLWSQPLKCYWAASSLETLACFLNREIVSTITTMSDDKLY